jgi:hypothetical protein
MGFQFAKRVPFTFVWRITDTSTPPLPIDDCSSVVATLYAGRSTTNPDFIPGTAVPAFSNQTLVHTSDGNYEVEVGSSPLFDALPSTNYRIVIDAVRDGEPFGHWEEDAAVIVNS